MATEKTAKSFDVGVSYNLLDFGSKFTVEAESPEEAARVVRAEAGTATPRLWRWS